MRSLVLVLIALTSLAACERSQDQAPPAEVSRDAGVGGAVPVPVPAVAVDAAPVMVDAAPAPAVAPDAIPDRPAKPKQKQPKRKPEPAAGCGPVCKMYCPHGNVLDSSGCPTCRCNKDPGLVAPKKCPRMPACGLACQGPFAKDANGCTMCACADDGVRSPKP